MVNNFKFQHHFLVFFFLWQRLNYTMVRGVEKASMNFRMVGELRRETWLLKTLVPEQWDDDHEVRQR